MILDTLYLLHNTGIFKKILHIIKAKRYIKVLFDEGDSDSTKSAFREGYKRFKGRRIIFCNLYTKRS